MHVSRQKTKIPACPSEGWLSDGQRVLHFQPVVWDRWQQSLEVTSGQVFPDGAPPLPQRRARLSREEAVALGRSAAQRVGSGVHRSGGHPRSPHTDDTNIKSPSHLL